MDTRGNTRLLIVDDEQSIRDILARTLKQAGYECQVAVDAADALNRLEKGTYQAVLSDILMPGMTGVELLDRIKNKHPDIAVIMVTAVAETGTAVDALKRGASDYITKPFNLEEVIISVERCLEMRNLELANRDYRDHLEQRVRKQTDEIREMFMGAMRSLAGALEAKDCYTLGHSDRVTEIAVIIAGEAGLSEHEVDQVRLAATVHDIGKIGLPESILQKQGRLTSEEFEQVKKHPDVSERILEPVVRDRDVLAIVRHHHERFDGKGYPDGLKGEEIPLGARIICVADAYDAMTSDRPYRAGVSPEDTRKQMRTNRGTQFDPDLVDLFMKIERQIRCCPVPLERKAS